MENHWPYSHDFIGEFTTSYRELARGQSHFNVYEVRGDGHMAGGCCTPLWGSRSHYCTPWVLRSPGSFSLLHLWASGSLCGCYIHDAILGCYGPQGPSQRYTLVCRIPKGPPPPL